jgi:Flp pilus assembly protein TadG
MSPRQGPSEDGFSAIWVAFCLFFLLGAAALAVDVSSFYETARTDQTTADLACLAGVPHLPEDAATARAAAAENVQRNYVALASTTPSTAGNTLTLADGSGATVQITTPFNGDSAKMHVLVTETDQAVFGRVLGADDVPVTQEAYCKVFAGGGGGSLPFGALPGGWAGGLQAPNPCGQNSGNCGALVIPRNDVNGVGPTLINNIALGADRNLDPWLGSGSGAVDCDNVGSMGTCHIVSTDTGVSASHLGQGFVERFNDDPARDCTMVVSGEALNCDSPTQVLGGSPESLFTAMGTQPGWWDTSLYGPWTAINTAAHHYWNDSIAKCESPRFASMPIISEDMDWDLGDPPPTWPNGTKDVKVVGMYNLIVTDPNDSGDFQGNGNLKNAASIIMWFGPDAKCVGPTGSTTPFSAGAIKTFRLVDANA